MTHGKVRTPTLLAAIATLLIVGCAQGPSTSDRQLPTETTGTSVAGSASFYFKLPTTANRNRYMTVQASPIMAGQGNDGNAVNIKFTIRQAGQVGRSVELLAPLDLTLAQRIADDDLQGNIPESEVFQFGVQLAQQSICKGQQITANTRGRRITNSADISRVLAANGGRVLGGRVPSNVASMPIPSVELSRFGWTVSLWCQ